MFFSSHLRHHRFTQNAPLDQENPMPIRMTVWDFLGFGFLNFKGAWEIISQAVRAAVGIYPTGHLGWSPEWEATLYPPGNTAARAPAQRWAQLLVLGHASVALATWAFGWPPMLPLLLSFGPFINGWLFFLCNATQHVGLHNGVQDFRLNTRSFVLHPAISFIYWRMNWHTEHHMFPAVPCYNLGALHEAIKHDLPPPPVGILGVWRVIVTALREEAANPSWRAPIQVPPAGGGVAKKNS